MSREADGRGKRGQLSQTQRVKAQKLVLFALYFLRAGAFVLGLARAVSGPGNEYTSSKKGQRLRGSC